MFTLNLISVARYAKVISDEAGYDFIIKQDHMAERFLILISKEIRPNDEGPAAAYLDKFEIDYDDLRSTARILNMKGGKAGSPEPADLEKALAERAIDFLRTYIIRSRTQKMFEAIRQHEGTRYPGTMPSVLFMNFDDWKEFEAEEYAANKNPEPTNGFLKFQGTKIVRSQDIERDKIYFV